MATVVAPQRADRPEIHHTRLVSGGHGLDPDLETKTATASLE